MEIIENKTTIFQNVGRILLGSFLTYTGIGHLTFLRRSEERRVGKEC